MRKWSLPGMPKSHQSDTFLQELFGRAVDGGYPWNPHCWSNDSFLRSCVACHCHICTYSERLRYRTRFRACLALSPSCHPFSSFCLSSIQSAYVLIFLISLPVDDHQRHLQKHFNKPSLNQRTKNDLAISTANTIEYWMYYIPKLFLRSIHQHYLMSLHKKKKKKKK